MSDDPVVIVGASLGGLRTAEALRRAGYSGPVIVIGEEVHAPYNRPPLSKEALTAGVTHQELAFPARPATSDVEWMLGVRAIGVDLRARTVTLHDGSAVRYGDLVIATGLRPRRLPLPFIAGRHTLRTLDDAMELRDALVPSARVVVAGSGFIGCEVAATAKKLGCSVTVVSRGDEPLIRPLGRMLGGELRRRHEAHGIAFRGGCRIVRLEGADRLTGVLLDDGSVLPADVLVEAIGCEPNTGWLASSGLDLTDGVLADAAMHAIQTDGVVCDDVFVVGDIARFPNGMFGPEARRIEHWNIPTETGRRAGTVLAAKRAGADAFAAAVAAPFTPMPAFWSIQLDVDLQAYGLPELADREVVLEGDLDGDVIVGYFRGRTLVGVVGLGMKAALLPYREQIAKR